jgi:two-component system response regulator MprA
MPTVLFTDADRESREDYVWPLSSYGFEVETADAGLECLANLPRTVPDLLILDLEMPWGGGDGVLATLREHAQLLPIRVALTLAVAPAHVLDGLACSCSVS